MLTWEQQAKQAEDTILDWVQQVEDATGKEVMTISIDLSNAHKYYISFGLKGGGEVCTYGAGWLYQLVDRAIKEWLTSQSDTRNDIPN